MASKPEDLEQSVKDERARVNATIEEIQHRLTPGRLIDEALNHGRAEGKDFITNLGRTLAANPVPTALVGIGLWWLLVAPKPRSAAAVLQDAAKPGTPPIDGDEHS